MAKAMRSPKEYNELRMDDDEGGEANNAGLGAVNVFEDIYVYCF